MKISKAQARQFLVRHQLLLPPQQKSGSQAVEDVFRHLRMIQYDPLNPCGRNIDLVLQSRIGDYHPNAYWNWVYELRQAVEGYDKVLCLIPVEDYGYLQHGIPSMWSARQDFAAKHRVELDAVVGSIRTNGPIATGGIVDERTVDIGWYGENAWGKVALETLWRMGELVVTRSPSQRKAYDIPERVYGSSLPTVMPTIEEHIERRVGSVGVLPASGSGTGWLGVGLGRQLRPTIKRMMEQGRLVEIQIEGLKPTYVVRKIDADTIELPAVDVVEPIMSFIAPLDTLVWDRTMVKDLFDFEYKWEVYVPLDKRNYGYYVLPLLYGDRLVGRIEPFFNKDGNLEIKGLWRESADWDSKMELALQQALGRFKKYLHADKVIGYEAGLF